MTGRTGVESVEHDAGATEWVLVAGVGLFSISLGAYEIVPASITPLVRDGLGVGPSAAGLLVSVMFGTAVLTSVPVGIGLDRTDTRLAIVGAVLAFVVAGAWGWAAARAGAYWPLVGSRVLGGFAYVVAWNGGIDIVGRAFGAGRRASAIGVFTASAPAGFAVGQIAGPWVAAAFGWPAVFAAFVGPAIVGLVAFVPVSRGRGHAEGASAPTVAELGATLTDRRVWTVGALGFLGFSLYLFVNSWGPSYLNEARGLSLAVSGLLVGLFPAVGIVGRVSGGVVSDRLFDGRRRPMMLLSFLAATPAVAGVALAGGVPLLVASLLVAGLAVQLGLGLTFAYVRELVEPGVAATAVAFLTSVGLLGAFVAPIGAGMLIGRAGYAPAFAAATAVGALGLGLAWLAPEP